MARNVAISSIVSGQKTAWLRRARAEIRAAVTNTGLTQEQACRIAGVSERTLKNYLRGDGLRAVAALLRLREAAAREKAA